MRTNDILVFRMTSFTWFSEERKVITSLKRDTATFRDASAVFINLLATPLKKKTKHHYVI